MNMADLAKVIKSNPGLKYVDNFLSKDRSVYKGRKTARKTQRGGDCGEDGPHIVGGARRRRSRKAASKKSRKSRKGSKKSRKSRRRRRSSKGVTQKGGNPLEDLVGGRR